MIIGITGYKGFIGTHLKNFLSLKTNISIVTIDKEDFENELIVQSFVKQCNVIVHLAGVNRHASPEYVYDKNIQLVQTLISACEATNSKPHILFSSSTQEEKNNEFGNAKKQGREMLQNWANANQAKATGMVIPNVFGPFGKPYYNSVVATFCHQLINNETPTIQVDGELRLIYINELVEDIFALISNQVTGKVNIEPRYTKKVSEILEILNQFKKEYLQNGVFPDISTPFNLALFNSFRCYIPTNYYPRPFKLNTDNRGTFVEIARTGSSGQFSYSTTKPSITRGNHFHTRKAERFAVIKGKAKISLRRIDTEEVIDYIITDDAPAYVDMPIWYTHNITNIGEDELLTLFWINEPYNDQDPDTYFVNV